MVDVRPGVRELLLKTVKVRSVHGNVQVFRSPLPCTYSWELGFSTLTELVPFESLQPLTAKERSYVCVTGVWLQTVTIGGKMTKGVAPVRAPLY